MNEQQIFQQFFGPQFEQNTPKIPEYIIHNDTIIEITNNWDAIIDLFKRLQLGNQKVDQLEHTWYTFIMANNINLGMYKTKEEFLEANLKVPDNIN
jgi:hypothetical protein